MVTIKELAKATGLSLTTISIVLRGKGEERNISQSTINIILKKAKERGYIPNIAARSLREGNASNQFQLAVFETQDFRASMMVRFLDSLRNELSKIKKDSRLVIFPYENDKLSQCKALMSDGDCHAGIICNASTKDIAFLETASLSIPIVLYNRYSHHYSSVNVDDAAIGKTAAQAMVTNSCQQVAVLTSEPIFAGMTIRNDSFEQEAAALGATILTVPHCTNTVKGGYNTTLEHILPLFTKGFGPLGIFCGTSSIAQGALRALYEAKIQIPELCQLVAVGNGPEEIDAHTIPSLSVVRLPMEEMAGNCLLLLLDTMAGKIAAPFSLSLPFQYVARETCGSIKF